MEVSEFLSLRGWNSYIWESSWVSWSRHTGGLGENNYWAKAWMTLNRHKWMLGAILALEPHSRIDHICSPPNPQGLLSHDEHSDTPFLAWFLPQPVSSSSSRGSWDTWMMLGLLSLLLEQGFLSCYYVRFLASHPYVPLKSHSLLFSTLGHSVLRGNHSEPYNCSQCCPCSFGKRFFQSPISNSPLACFSLYF